MIKSLLMRAGYPFQIRFSPEREEEFRTDSFGESMAAIRFGLILAIVLWTLFAVLDVYLLPLSYQTIWKIRFIFVLPFLFIMVAIPARYWRRKLDLLVFLIAMVLGGSILAMIHFASAPEPGFHYYHAGLLLVILWIGSLSQLRFKYVLLSVFAICIGFFYEAIVRHRMADGGTVNDAFPIFASFGFFMASAAVLSIYCAYNLESYKRNNFRQKKIIEAEKVKTQNLLNQIEVLFGQQVSEEVAEELKNGGHESKLYQVTVMFLDIRDFTAYADSREPEEVARFQNAVFGEVIHIVRRHRGVINQIMGDGVMATFGAPVRSDTHATDAVSAGFDILQTIERLSGEGEIPAIRIGIGLHSGQVLAGSIGNEHRKQYSLAGTTVNIASRIEQLNKNLHSQFLISRAVYEACQPTLHCKAESLGEFELRGIGRAIELYRLA